MTERQQQQPRHSTTQQQPRTLTNDELAAQLQKCAILVKQNNKTDPLVRQTVHDLTFFLTGKRVSSRSSQTGTTVVSNHHKTASSASAHSSSPTRSVASTHSTTTVSKPYYSPHHSVKSMTGQFVKAMGLGPPLESKNSGDHSERSRKSIEEKQATSSKNAARAKADLEQLSKGSASSLGTAAVETVHGGGTTDDWCEAHFTRGCACQQRTSTTAANATSMKPAFQRPQHPGSAVLANGWVEQQRRSKMRTVWKEVLASVVEGRQPGEETTLWIQREVVHPVTHKKELEALHQIPVKWLEAVHYSNYSTDHRFVLKVYNLHEDFVFRCENNQEAAQNWVLTLRSIMELYRNNGKKVETALDDNSEWNEFKSRTTQEEEKKQDPTTMQAAGVGPPPGPPPPQHQHAPPQASSPLPPHAAAAQAQPQQPPHPSVAATPVTSRMTVKELRAIAHGFGVTTVGMERSDLEHIVQQIAAQQAAAPVPPHPPQPPPQQQQQQTASTQHPPPPPLQQPRASSSGPAAATTTTNAQVRSANSSVTSVPSDDEAASKAAAQSELARRRKLAEESERRRQLAEESAQARARSEAAVAAEQARQQQQQQEAERRRREEEERQRLERERRQREEEEHRRRVAEQQAAEQRRRQEEQARQQQQQWQQQQQQWQAQQAEAARQRQSEQQRAEQQRRQQEEAYRQWQQPRAGPQPPPPQQQQQPYPPYGHPQPQFHSQQSQFPGQQQQPHAHHPPPPPGGSPINMKYAQMAVQSNTASGMLPTIKHGILVEWALQPPSMQILRPIEVLVTSIHTVFPPKFGVPGHDHFARWKVVTLPEVLAGPGQPDDDKLNKVVKKLRFLLHPDKLPRDLSDEQQYMCKMLWDITHDAFEDHKKKVEELDWMK